MSRISEEVPDSELPPRLRVSGAELRAQLEAAAQNPPAAKPKLEATLPAPKRTPSYADLLAFEVDPERKALLAEWVMRDRTNLQNAYAEVLKHERDPAMRAAVEKRVSEL